MKRRSTLFAAAIAAFGAILILGLTGVLTITILTVGSLSNVDCQGCKDLSGVFTTAKTVGGAGVLFAAVTAWGIFRGLRPSRPTSSK